MKLKNFAEAKNLYEEYEALKKEIKDLKYQADRILNDDYYGSVDFNVKLKKGDKRVDGIRNLDYTPINEIKKSNSQLEDHLRNWFKNLESENKLTPDFSLKMGYVNESNDMLDSIRYNQELYSLDKGKLDSMTFTINNNEMLLVLSTIIHIRENNLDRVIKSLNNIGIEL